MTIFNKIKWIVAITVVFLLILATNLIDRKNFTRIEDSVEIIYREQLLTKDAMMELINEVHRKEIAYFQKDTVYFREKSDDANFRMLALLDKCTHDNMIKNEELLLNALGNQVEGLITIEKDTALFDLNSGYQSNINNVKAGINELAKVQVEKGKNQKLLSRDAIASSNLFSQIEIYILIAIAVVIQIIVVYPSKRADSQD